MSRMFDFKGMDLVNAMRKTFKKRNTDIVVHPQVFYPSFCKDKNKQTQWKAFLTKSKLTNAPENFCDVVADIEKFLKPVLDAIIDGKVIGKKWKPSEKWLGI